MVIPAENCQLSLSLQGVRAPQNSGTGEPAVFGDESLLLTRFHFLQVGRFGAFRRSGRWKWRS